MDSIVLPTGFAGRAREMKVSEQRIFADRRLTKSGAFADEILRACWIETTDLGPYTAEAKGHPDWSKVLSGDRFVALLRIRCETHGDEYDFKVPCSACKEQIAWRIHLLRDLPVKPYDRAAVERHFAGALQETTARDGKIVRYKLLDGADEKRLKQLRAGSPDEPLSFALLSRIVEVDGLEKKDIRPWVLDMGMRTASGLLAAFEAPEGGVETKIEIACNAPGCGVSQDVEIPFDGGFWMPKGTTGT